MALKNHAWNQHEPSNTFMGWNTIFLWGWLFAVFFCSCYSWNQTSFYSKWIDFFVRYLEMLSKMPWQPTEKRHTNKRWKENNQPHNGRNKIDTGLICSMKCPLKHAKWIWMNFELIRSVTVLGKRQLFIAKNAETKYLSKKNRSENIARKGRRKLTKLRILWKKLTVIGTVWQRFDSVFSFNGMKKTCSNILIQVISFLWA